MSGMNSKYNRLFIRLSQAQDTSANWEGTCGNVWVLLISDGRCFTSAGMGITNASTMFAFCRRQKKETLCF